MTLAEALSDSRLAGAERSGGGTTVLIHRSRGLPSHPLCARRGRAVPAAALGLSQPRRPAGFCPRPGLSGSRAQLERVTTEWRKQLPPPCKARKKTSRPVVVPPPNRQQLSPQQASWLFVIDQTQLTVEQQGQVEQCAQAREELAHAYRICQRFTELLRERKAEDLKDWLRCARASQIPELQGLAKSMQQDYRAIYAACSQPWSQGQVEGNVNRLKCIKRQLYGRAKFDLFRRRVLLAI